MIKTVTFSDLSKETLNDLYVELGQTCEDIGLAVGLTADAILWKLKRNNINRTERSKKDVNLVFNGERKDKKKGLTKEKLLELCLQKKSDEEIGRMFGMTGEDRFEKILIFEKIP